MNRRRLLTCSLTAIVGWPLAARAQDGALRPLSGNDPLARSSTSPRNGRCGRGTPGGIVPEDPDRLTAEERRHVPVLVLPEQVRAGRPFDLVVQVGVEPHPMTPTHHIDWIEVLLGDTCAFAVDLSEHVGYPVVRVPLRLASSAVLSVRSHCTLHDTWLTMRRIDVR